MIETLKEKHNRLFDQFVKEMFVDPETPQKCKPSGGLPKKASTRSKWLSKKENLKGPHEERAEMPPLSSAHDNPRGHGGRKNNSAPVGSVRGSPAGISPLRGVGPEE